MNKTSLDEVNRFFNQGTSLAQETSQSTKGNEFLSTKNKRRSKKDKTGRNYVCGCGKEYLSYPALYTHIKTKHDGVPPEGTKAHQSQRGRPKKVDVRADENRTIPDKDMAPFSLNFLHQSSSYIKTDGLPFLNDFVEKADLRLLGEYNLDGETDPTVGFPIIHVYDNNKPSFHPFHSIINNLKDETKYETILSNHCCDTVISLFLFSASKITAEKFYLVLGVFFRNLRECLNEQGYEIIAEYFMKNYSEEARSLIPKKKEDKTFCEVEPLEYLPLVSDKFILEYLPKYCPEFDQQLAVDLMFDFCKWLVKRKFTKIRVMFNDDDNSDVEAEASPKYWEGNEGFGKLFGVVK